MSIYYRCNFTYDQQFFSVASHICNMSVSLTTTISYLLWSPTVSTQQIALPEKHKNTSVSTKKHFKQKTRKHFKHSNFMISKILILPIGIFALKSRLYKNYKFILTSKKKSLWSTSINNADKLPLEIYTLSLLSICSSDKHFTPYNSSPKNNPLSWFSINQDVCCAPSLPLFTSHSTTSIYYRCNFTYVQPFFCGLTHL